MTTLDAYVILEEVTANFSGDDWWGRDFSPTVGVWKEHVTSDISMSYDQVLDAVYQILVSGEVLEEYSDDLPYPSRLIMGWHEGRPLHVVAALDSDERKEIVITINNVEVTG